MRISGLDKISSTVYYLIMNESDENKPLPLTPYRATLRLLRTLLHAQRLAETQIDGLLGEFDLSATRYFALCQLMEAQNAVSLSQLAAQLAFVKSNATQVVDNLQANQLVARVPSPEDRRCIQVQMTAEGKTRHDEAMEALGPLVEKIQSTFTDEERTQLLMLLQRLDKALG